MIIITVRLGLLLLAHP